MTPTVTNQLPAAAAAAAAAQDEPAPDLEGVTRPRFSVKKETIVEQQGKPHVLYAGLLDAATEAGLAGIMTELVQAPSAGNDYVCIFKATATFPWGAFDAHGDAKLDDVNRMMKQAYIRLAETRAKARALRDGLNIWQAPVDDPDHADATFKVWETRGRPATQNPEPRSETPARTSGSTRPPAPANGAVTIPTAAAARQGPAYRRPEAGESELRSEYGRLSTAIVAAGGARLAELAIDAPVEFIREASQRAHAELRRIQSLPDRLAQGKGR